MNVGQPGLCGPLGYVGVSGADNLVTGASGATGPSPTGPSGVRGVTGDQGPTGADGPPGAGPQGPPGPDGEPGDPLKLAILPTLHGPRSLYCLESPQVWLEDFTTVHLKGNHGIYPIDPIFLQLCEDIFIVATVPNKAIHVWSESLFSSFELRTSVIGFFAINVTLRGLRKGFSSHRFLPHTEAQRLHNNAFWSQAQ